MCALLVNKLTRKIWLVLLLVQFSNLYAQSSDPPWTRTYGLEYDDQGRHILPTEDGGYIFLGVLVNAETNSEDMWLVKLDSKGDMLWQEIYGGSLSDRGSRVIPDSDGEYLLAGYTQSYGAGGYDVWLVKIDSSGVPQWQKTYGDTLDDYAFSVIPAENKGYIIAGTTTSTKYGKYDFWVFQVDSMGNLGWETIMGGVDQDQARSIKQTSDGGYIIAGYTVTDLDRRYDLWLVKLDSNGDSLWSKTYGGNERDAGISVLEMPDNKIMILGYTNSFEGNRDIWILITDPEGDVIQASTFGGPYSEYGHILNTTNDGNYIITGYTESFGAGGWDLLILKVDGEGNEIWSKTYGGSLKDFGQYIYQDQSGGYVCIGITESFGAGGWDAWVIWTDSTGNTVPPTFSEEPLISDISDIPFDQGGWVNVQFYRSSYDTDSLILSKAISAELYTVEINVGSGWTAAASTTAYGKPIYSVLVPTTKDSTSESNGLIDFRVIAGMEEGNFVSNIVSGYSVDNLKPAVPAGVGAALSEGFEVILSWQPNIENDFKYYTVYRLNNGSIFENIGKTIETSFTDSDILTGNSYSYAVTATDHSGNESEHSEIVTINITNIDKESRVPIHYYLSQNYPNPFNPITTIKYGILKTGDVKINIYDILGNNVKELVNRKLNEGHHQVIWNGTNKQNELVSSGIYYYQIVTENFQDIKKMILVR